MWRNRSRQVWEQEGSQSIEGCPSTNDKTRSKAVFSLLRVGKLIIQELYKKADISSKRVCRLRTSDSPRSFRHAFGTSLPWKSIVIRDLRIIFTIEYLLYANTLVFSSDMYINTCFPQRSHEKTYDYDHDREMHTRRVASPREVESIKIDRYLSGRCDNIQNGGESSTNNERKT